MDTRAIPRLYERDIDVLLQEELLFNSDLLCLLAKSLTLTQPIRIHRCELSIVDVTGETDLVADFTCGPVEGKILIENKIDAAFQKLQPQRYRDRVETMKEQGNSCYSVLIAPRSYLEASADGLSYFDGSISYEDITSSILKEATARSEYRASLVKQAVDQAKRSYVLVPAEDVTTFWHRVYQLASVDFAELRMKQPGQKGSYTLA